MYVLKNIPNTDDNFQEMCDTFCGFSLKYYTVDVFNLTLRHNSKYSQIMASESNAWHESKQCAVRIILLIVYEWYVAHVEP